jgi:hypothetical protein
MNCHRSVELSTFAMALGFNSGKSQSPVQKLRYIKEVFAEQRVLASTPRPCARSFACTRRIRLSVKRKKRCWISTGRHSEWSNALISE